jgi:hypothetical protein
LVPPAKFMSVRGACLSQWVGMTFFCHHILRRSNSTSFAAQRLSSRALFRSELDDDALGDIRLALAQSQPPRDDRFAERICAKVGVRRALAKRGRPPGKAQSADGMDEQTAFGF